MEIFALILEMKLHVAGISLPTVVVCVCVVTCVILVHLSQFVAGVLH